MVFKKEKSEKQGQQEVQGLHAKNSPCVREKRLAEQIKSTMKPYEWFSNI